MSAALFVFWPNFLMLGLAAPGLALLGAQASARGRLLSVFTLSQAALLLSLLFAKLLHAIPENLVVLLTASAVCALSRWRADRRRQDPLSDLALGIALLLASGAVLSQSPELESRRIAGFFGDPSLLSALDCLWVGAVFGALTFALWKERRRWLLDAFEGAMSRSHSTTPFHQDAILALALSVAIVKLGLIFSISVLVLPAFFARASKSFSAHQLFLLGGTTFATLAGFALSLALESVPSVYVIGGALVMIGAAWVAVHGRRGPCKTCQTR